MYSLGRYYFTTVLDGLGQEASYFTLSNQWWQLQALDTAYVPFSISGGTVDTRLQPQMDWIVDSIKCNTGKKNIFLTHNQPVSAHLPEFEASYPPQPGVSPHPPGHRSRRHLRLVLRPRAPLHHLRRQRRGR